MFKIRMAMTVLSLCGALAATHIAQTQENQEGAKAMRGPSLADDYGKVPLSFEANHGQTDTQVRFTSRGNGYSLFLTDSAAVLALTRKDGPKPGSAVVSRIDHMPAAGKSTPSFDETIRALKQDRMAAGGRSAPEPTQAPMKAQTTEVVRMELAGARPGARVEGEEKLPGVANYFIGNDPAKWQTSVPTYARVKYTSVYPGIDLVYYGNQRQLEYDFIVAPGSDPDQLRLHFAGAEKLKLNDVGDLEIVAKDGEIAFHKPVIYQTKTGQPASGSANQRESVDGKFVLLEGDIVGFKLGSYDKSRTLVIDPTLAYSTYLGGSGYHIPAGPDCCGDYGASIAVDTAGSAYVTGETGSADFPVTMGALQIKSDRADSNGDAFVSKLNAAGTALVYSTYLGGSGNYYFGDYGKAITVDSLGHAYITGYTSSTNFPVTTGAYQSANGTTANGGYTAFVTELNKEGNGLVYSTYLGGSGLANCCGAPFGDQGQAIVLDAENHVLIAGTTYSTNFPVTVGAYQQVNNAKAINGSSIFLTKLDGAGNALIYSTYLGGSGYNEGCCYFFSSGDRGSGLAVDGTGSAYVTGYAWSKDFPVTEDAYQKTNNEHNSLNNTGASNYSAFVSKFNPTGTALVYSTYLGGSGNPSYGDAALGIAVDSSCHAYVAGYAGSADFPTTGGVLQPSDLMGASNGPVAGFVTKLNTEGTALEYSTYLSGTAGGRGFVGDTATAIAVDAGGHAFVTGTAQSQTGFPTTTNAYQTINPEAANPGADYYPGAPYVAALNAGGTALHYSSFIGGSSGDAAAGIALDASGNPYITGNTLSGNFPILPDPGSYQPTNHAIAAGNSGSTNAFVAKLSVGYGVVIEPTAITLTSDPNPSLAGATVTFTAHVQQNTLCGFPPAGTVTFQHGGTVIGTGTLSGGVATLEYSGLTVGDHSITATYEGSATYSTSTSAALSQVVEGGLIDTTTALSSSPNPSTLGESVTFTATVTPASGAAATGTVTFSHGGTSIGAATLSGGVAKLAYSGLAVGDHSMTATYEGSSMDATSTSVALTQVVDPAPAKVAGQPSPSVKSLPPPAPTFSPAAGTYAAPQTVGINHSYGATVYYTTNGATPTISSTRYTGPFVIGKTETLKAIAVQNAQSGVTSGVYTIE